MNHQKHIQQSGALSSEQHYVVFQFFPNPRPKPRTYGRDRSQSRSFPAMTVVRLHDLPEPVLELLMMLGDPQGSDGPS